MSKLLIERKMHKLEDNQMKEYLSKDKPRAQSSVRIRSSCNSEAERDGLRKLTETYQELGLSIKDKVKKEKKIKTFLALTREMLMKNRHLGIFKNEAPLLRSLGKNPN
jgi:hypothetical protein